MIRAAERWRAVKVTEFERRQMAAVRQDLDQTNIPADAWRGTSRWPPNIGSAGVHA
jgi:hypothetical protein